MRSHQRVLASVFTISLRSLALGLGTSAAAQEPIDLSPDNPELASGFVRICAWNLRHTNPEEEARPFLPGQQRLAAATQEGLHIHLMNLEQQTEFPRHADDR